MDRPGTVELDSTPLMRQLTRMANIPFTLAKRVVLVLAVDSAPILFVETYLTKECQETLIETKLLVSDKPIVVDMTTMQNKKW